MFAKLAGLAHTRSATPIMIDTSVWIDLTWVETPREATKLSPEEAHKLVGELNTRDPGPEYTYERDENGMSNQPPYGLDNFVVKKTATTK